MRIEPVSFIKPVEVTQLSGTKSGGGVSGQSFGDMLKDALKDVNHLQTNADQTAIKLATGDLQDVHEAVLAMKRASTALQLTIQVRNKAVEAYQEIMRTQV